MAFGYLGELLQPSSNSPSQTAKSSSRTQSILMTRSLRQLGPLGLGEVVLPSCDDHGTLTGPALGWVQIKRIDQIDPSILWDYLGICRRLMTKKNPRDHCINFLAPGLSFHSSNCTTLNIWIDTKVTILLVLPSKSCHKGPFHDIWI